MIGIIQELKLLWKKEQDKSRVLNHRIERLKHEIGKAEERIHILSSDKSLLENRLHQVDSEVEALK